MTDNHMELREATVTIDGQTLTFAQVMAMRVAVQNMLMEVTDPEYRKTLGTGQADGYAVQLRVVEKLLVDGWNRKNHEQNR